MAEGMTPEQRIEEAVAYPVGALSRFDPRGRTYLEVAVVPDWKQKLAAAIRDAVAEERQRCEQEFRSFLDGLEAEGLGHVACHRREAIQRLLAKMRKRWLETTQPQSS